MTNLSQIKTDSNWGLEAPKLNQNFQNISTDILKLKNSTIRFKGYHTSEEGLKSKYPAPQSGDYAWVGTPYPGKVYDVVNGQWHNTNQDPPAESVDLVNYYTKEEINSITEGQDVKLSKLEEVQTSQSEEIKQLGEEVKKGGSGNLILTWNTDVATTRKSVPSDKRKEGLQISYKENDKEWKNEQYIGNAFDDSSWANNANWKSIASDIEVDKELNEESEKPVANSPVTKGINEVKQQLSTQLPAIEQAKEDAIHEIGNKENEAIQNFSEQKVTPTMLSPETVQLINASGGGTITNLPDGETLAEVEMAEGTKAIGIPDRAADTNMGYVILKKNKSLIEQVTEENTIYEIRYSYDLGGETLEMPDNCVLKFEGGLINNGGIKGNNTGVVAPFQRIFSNLKFTGYFFIENVYPEWFGAKPFNNNASYVGGDVISISSELDDYPESGEAINNALKLSTLSNGIVPLQNKMYKTTSTIQITSGQHLFIPRGCTVVPYMNGNGRKITTVTKDDSTASTKELETQPEVISENEYIPTSEMAVCISVNSVKTKITGYGTICLSKSKFTIGIDLFGVGYSYMDMAFTPIIEASVIGAGKNVTWSPDVRDTIGDLNPTNEQGKDGDFYYNRVTNTYFRKESGSWIQKSPAYNQGSLFNVSLRLEANGNDYRIINPYITLFDMYGWRGMEIITSSTGWINESIIKGTISNKHGSFISVFAHGGGVSIHDWSKIVMQVGRDMQNDCRLFFASKCNVVTVGNIWDLAWFNPIRVSKAFELCKKAGNVTLTGTDGINYVIDNGYDNKYPEHPDIAFDNAIVSKLYDNVVQYRTPYSSGGFSASKKRTHDSIISFSELVTEDVSSYNDEVSHYFFDNDDSTCEKVIDTNNNLFSYCFNLNLSNKNNIELLNYRKHIFIEIDFVPNISDKDNKCYVAIASSSYNIPAYKTSLRSINKLSSSGGHQIIQKLFVPFSRIGRLDDVRIIFYAEDNVPDTVINVTGIKIWKDSTYFGAWSRPEFGGDNKYLPNAAPCGKTYYDKTNDMFLYNKGDSQNPDWMSLNKIKIRDHTSEDVSIEIEPTVLHRWKGVTNLDLTLKSGENKNYSEEFMIEFTTASEGEVNINIAGVTWAGGVPECINNKTYQVSIMNNLAIIAQF